MTVTLRIEKSVYGGDGLGRLADGRVCFVPGAFEGETVRAELTEQKKSFVRARCAEIVEASPDRTRKLGEQPPADSPIMPGMVYSDVNYAAELRFKEEQLGNFLERVGQSYQHIEVVAGQSLGYRNKVTYHLQQEGGRWLIGYRREMSHDVVDVESDPRIRFGLHFHAAMGPDSRYRVGQTQITVHRLVGKHEICRCGFSLIIQSVRPEEHDPYYLL